MSESDYCEDPHEEERKGREAAYDGRRDWTHEERLRNARFEGPDSCDAHYAKGFEDEERRQDRAEQEFRAREEFAREEWEREQYERHREEEELEP